MLWEKKIQLAKETQSALDPNVGATEIREMSLEIHRMTLRYASMLKLQEKMIAEMEKSVYRRESISSKGKAKGKGAGQLSLQKHITDLTRKIQQAVQDIKDCEQGSAEVLTPDIVDLQQSNEVMKEQIDESGKSVYANAILVFQKLQKRYSEVADKKYVFVQPDVEARSTDLLKSQQRLDKVKQVVSMLSLETLENKKHILGEYSWFIDSCDGELKSM
ncbi:Coiled-coil domain-containing protein 40 [Kappamyces sp. JEL0680]|nr:Coiled-coil domain-containing protein 40 [Kappamyces sp. JEL0680]